MATTAAEKTLLLCALDYPPGHGGIQTLTVEVYSRLADIVRLVVAPALPPATAEPETGLATERSRFPSGRGFSTLRFLLDVERRLRTVAYGAEVLHCNHVFAAAAGRRLRRHTGVPYIVWVHGEELTKTRFPWVLRAGLSEASAILANSQFTAACVRGALPERRRPPIHVIPLGAPPALLAAPAAVGLPPGPPRFLTVARLCRRDRYKGVDVALQAMGLLRQRGQDFHYRIVGEGDDRGYLQGLAEALGLAQQVEFCGAATPSALAAHYDQCDIFLLCSREQSSPRGLGFEGFGIVFLEAGARGKPVVGGRSGGIADAVAEGESGLLVEPTDPAAVADALQRLVRDPKLRLRLGAAGRARVRNRYNWENAAAEVRAIHAAVLRMGASPCR